MNELKPVLRLIVVTLTFLLFAVVFLPALVRYLQHPWGRVVYGLFAALCVALALLLRRRLAELE